jgi:hypothetical protein
VQVRDLLDRAGTNQHELCSFAARASRLTQS